MYSDASGKLGYSAICLNSWQYAAWDNKFIKRHKPSIEYLELYALTAGVVSWIHRFKNRRIMLFCDNETVVKMIWKNTTSCKHCMKLVRIVVLYSMIHNVRVFAQHLKSAENCVADALSRLDIPKFRHLSKDKYEDNPTPTPGEMWPVCKVW